MAGFEDIGALIGLPAGNELAYQKGLALGARTQDALQQARERVRQNTAMDQLTGLADELGLTPGLVTAIRAGVDPRQITGAANELQERHFHDIAGSPDENVGAGARNRALFGLAKGPVETLKAVGSKGYEDILHPELGVQAIPGAAAGGGDAAAIQVLRAFGFLDENGRVVPGKERQAFDTMRSTLHTVDMGGVPGVIDANPFAGLVPPAPHASAPAAVPPAAAGATSNPLADLIPPAPVGTPPLPATSAAPAATSTPGTNVTPLSPVSQVASNVAEIEKAKKMGEAAGNNAAAMPDALADIDKMVSSIGQLVQSPGFDSAYGHIQGSPIGQQLTSLVSQDAANSLAMLKNLSAQTFGVTVQKMRGLGALSENEGKKVTDAFTIATNPTISPAIARAAWQDVLGTLDKARQRAQGKAQIPPASVPAGTIPAPATGGAPSPYADPAKEARYQAWKAAHGM